MTKDKPIVLLSLIEWQNLLAVLKMPIERYGIDAVREAVEYLTEHGENAR